MSGGGSPCLLVYGLSLYDYVSLMTNDLRVLDWITKAAQFSGREAKCGTDITCLDKIMVPKKKINYDNTVFGVGHPDSD